MKLVLEVQNASGRPAPNRDSLRRWAAEGVRAAVHGTPLGEPPDRPAALCSRRDAFDLTLARIRKKLAGDGRLIVRAVIPPTCRSPSSGRPYRFGDPSRTRSGSG